MQKIGLYLCWISLLVMSYSCQKELNYSIPTIIKPVVYANIHNNGITVYVSKSENLLLDELNPSKLWIQNAQIHIITSDTTLYIPFVKENMYHLYFDSANNVSKQYELKVAIPDFPLVKSTITNFIKNPVPAMQVSKGQIIDNGNQPLYSINLSFVSSVEKKSNYVVQISPENTDGTSIGVDLYGFAKYYDLQDLPCNYSINSHNKILTATLDDICSDYNTIDEDILFSIENLKKLSIKCQYVDGDYIKFLKSQVRSTFSINASDFPDISNSNISNGYGYFYISYEKSFQIIY